MELNTKEELSPKDASAQAQKPEVTDPRTAVSAADFTQTPKNRIALAKPRPLDLDPSIYLRDNYVVIDFETTNLDHGSPINPDNRIILACWYSGEGRNTTLGASKGFVHSKFGNEFEQWELADAIERASFVVAYHAKFELGWFKRMGLNLRDIIIYDPMLGEYVIGGNIKPKGGLSLDETLKRYGIRGKMSYVRALIETGVCPSNIAERDLREYCIRDVEQTLHLFLQQRRRIFRKSLDKVLYGRCLQTPMLADIESRGVYLDRKRVRSKRRIISSQFSDSERKLNEFCGVINWRSSKQVREIVYGKLGFKELQDYKGREIRTPAGKPSTAEETLAKLVATTDSQRKFKRIYGELAPLKKLVQTLEVMDNICETDNGHFFAQFNQAITQNQRLSSTGLKWGLQLQNQPRSFKELFCTGSKGRQVAEGDCPQLEFRTVVDLSRDRAGKADILARVDVHSLTASVTGLSRQDSKPYTFKPIYGARSGPPWLRRYIEAFRRRYGSMYQTQLGWVYSVLVHKFLDTPTGLRFYWPDTVRVGDYVTNTTKIFNYPVSMFAGADIAQLCLLLVWHNIGGLDSWICNCVHDSGILDTNSDEASIIERIMVQSYTEDIYEVLSKLYDYEFDTPLGLGFKIGDHWAEGEERKYEPEGRFKFTSDVPTTIKLSS